MNEIWKRLETWLAEHAPRILESLNPPATAESLAACEARLGVRLPEDVRASYIRHDGQAYIQPFGAPGLFDGWRWLPLAGVVRLWTTWKELLDNGTIDNTPEETNGQVVGDWWNAEWIPFADSGMGYDRSLDLHPGPRGSVGQVITVCHDDPRRPVLASSFREWLWDYLLDLEAGVFIWCPERQGIYRHDEPW
jgi:cell wall assembly regulator SMI1